MQEPKNTQAQRQPVGPRTPEEIATELEDALILQDRTALTELFEEHAVLSPPDRERDLRGSGEIALFVAKQWAADRRYLAQVRRVVQAGDTAAVVVDWSLSDSSVASTGQRGRCLDVLRRGSDGTWRYLIWLLDVCEQSSEQPTAMNRRSVVQ
jgi:ketosteroid isomerase-like protein